MTIIDAKKDAKSNSHHLINNNSNNSNSNNAIDAVREITRRASYGNNSSSNNSGNNNIITNNNNNVDVVTPLLANGASASNPLLHRSASRTSSAGGHSVRYSGVTRVMVYSPEQCSAHVGHVCSKHKTVTIPLDSIEAMRRAEIMWPIMR